MRQAALAGLLAGSLMLAASACADGPGWAPPAAAWFEAPGDVYPHRVLGAIPEYFVLAARDAAGRETRLDLREAPGPPRVFEDVAPRVVDADGDGTAEIVVVQSDLQDGAQLAIYEIRGGALALEAATPTIGQRFRWLAPVTIADLDGDGVTDLAYVETPHLGKRLRVWTWAPGGLTEIARTDGVTNHRIGDETISGGLRDCGAGPEMVLADAAWGGLVAVTLAPDRQLERRPLDLPATPEGFAAAAACEG